MGTRGLWAYRFRGRYYIRYSNWDSYPDSLGADIINTIPVDPTEFQAWKARIIAKYIKLEERLKRGSQLIPEFEYEPSWIPPLNDLFIEWVYVVDIDRDIFTVNENLHFKIQHVPRGTQSLEHLIQPQVGNPRRYIISEEFPKEFMGNINAPKPEPNPEYIELYRSSKPSISLSILPIESANRIREQLGKRLFIDFIAYYAFYLDELHQWCPQDEPFQQIAFAILCFACGCHIGFNFIEATGEQAEKLGKDRVPRWEYPNGDRYWLPNGVWVLLKTHLDDDLQVESAVGEVIAKARDDSLGFDKPFTAVIFSIEHVVIVTIEQGGKEVFRTGALRAYLNMLAGNGLGDYGKTQPKPAKSIDGFKLFPGFHALLRHFGSRSLCQTEDAVNQTRLPVELIPGIFEYIDPSTRRAFSNTSRLFQQVARRNPRPALGQYILEESIQETEFWAMDAERDRVVKLDILNEWQETPHPIIGVCLNYGRQKFMGMFHYVLKAGPGQPD